MGKGRGEKGYGGRERGMGGKGQRGKGVGEKKKVYERTEIRGT